MGSIHYELCKEDNLLKFFEWVSSIVSKREAWHNLWRSQNAFVQTPHKKQLKQLSRQRGGGGGDQVVAQIKNGEVIRNKKKEKWLLWHEVIRGVPQGSILGHLLFINYLESVLLTFQNYLSWSRPERLWKTLEALSKLSE